MSIPQKYLDNDTERWQEKLSGITGRDVEKALAETAGVYSQNRLIALIAPAAENYLEQMAQLAHKLTVRRFGRTIKLYAPLYLSNYCVNGCRYCGFNKDNKFHRTRLSIAQALEDAEVIASEGFTDILLVSSEDRKFISVEYLCNLAAKLRNKFSSISVEIYQMDTAGYAQLFKAGIEGVTLYQETYDRPAYSYYHQSGSKADYDDRLKTPDRIASARMRRIGLGVLLGLTDWRLETLALAGHANYLIKKYWQSQISFSFPRLRPALKVADEQFRHLLSDKNLVQMITALRLCFSDAGLILSTRESARLRNHLIRLGITKMSAGSKTNPGGYCNSNRAVEQFEVNDSRTVAEVADMIKNAGFDPVWKDWDRAFAAT